MVLPVAREKRSTSSRNAGRQCRLKGRAQTGEFLIPDLLGSIFDFGDNSSTTEGNQGTGRSYLFLTPRSASGTLRVAYSVNGSTSETRVSAAAALPSSGMHHDAVVANDAGDQLLLYVDGAPAGSAAWSGTLSAIHDINNWLGKSQYSSDAEFGGTLYEARIYGAALRPEQIALSFADGPDPAYLEP